MANKPTFTHRSVSATQDAVDTVTAWLEHYRFTQIAKTEGGGLYKTKGGFLNRNGLGNLVFEARVLKGALHLRAFFSKSPSFQDAKEVTTKGLRGGRNVAAAVALNGLFRALGQERISVPKKVRWYDWSFFLNFVGLVAFVLFLSFLALMTFEDLPFAKPSSLRFNFSAALGLLIAGMINIALVLALQIWLVKKGRTIWAKLFGLVFSMAGGLWLLSGQFLSLGLEEMNQVNRVVFYCNDTPNKQSCDEELEKFSKMQTEKPFPVTLRQALNSLLVANPQHEDVKFILSRIPASTETP
ncbi:hypothetical protein K2X33_03755 [bacterium]|nr:hypothetical protein [bacterium]